MSNCVTSRFEWKVAQCRWKLPRQFLLENWKMFILPFQKFRNMFSTSSKKMAINRPIWLHWLTNTAATVAHSYKIFNNTGSSSFVFLTHPCKTFYNFLKKTGPPLPLFLFFSCFSPFINNNFTEKLFTSAGFKLGSSDRRRALWPLDHHHGP